MWFSLPPTCKTVVVSTNDDVEHGKQKLKVEFPPLRERNPIKVVVAVLNSMNRDLDLDSFSTVTRR